MNILYIHQYFKTPYEPGGTRSYWISKKIIESGHKVTVLSTRTNQNESISNESIDGINVIYFNVKYNQGMGLPGRLWSFVRFMFAATSYLLSKRSEFDLVIATSTPLSVGFPALVAKWISGKKYIFEVRDLWPEVPIQMGAVSNPLLKVILRFYEKVIYKNAEHVVALSPGMLEGVVKRAPNAIVSMIPNMAKVDEFWPRTKSIELLKSLGLRENSFKIIHFGSLGIANGIMRILKSISLMKSDGSIEFIFLGAGATEKKLKDFCEDNNLTNVVFLPPYPMRETSEIVNICDVSLISFEDIPILNTNSPNKLFDSLSAGKPIIVNSSGWTKEMVETYKCGYYTNPKDPQDLCNKIKYLQLNDAIREEMGRNARMLAEESYDKEALTTKFVKIINSIDVQEIC